MSICEKCGKIHDGKFGSGRFCSLSCSNSRVPSKEHREKTSATLTGKKATKKDEAKWRASLSQAHKKRREDRLIEIMLLDFDALSEKEKRCRIFKEQSEKCLECGITNSWNGKSLKFDLDHIDGNHLNNARNNLRLICPNCHSQTPTYRKNNVHRIVSDLEYKEALESSPSIYKALEKLQVRRNGGCYRRARRIINQFNIIIKDR